MFFEAAFKPLEKRAAGLLNKLANVLYGKPGDLFESVQPNSISLPRDLFAHRDVQTEWWYYTGHCKTESGRSFGFEFVFFKRQTNHDRLGVLPLRLIANPMFAAHFAITDIDNGRFLYSDRKSFLSPLDIPATASETELKLKIGDWTIEEDGESHRLNAAIDSEIEFTANVVAEKPVALNSHEISTHGPKSKPATSHHFSFTRMGISGEISLDGTKEKFSGSAWMDREFGTWHQRNWDWFSIQLNDNTELMIYRFRSDELNRNSHGTFIDEDGNCIFLSSEEFSVKQTGSWQSPATGTTYPSGWEIAVEKLDLELKITPVLENQELDTRRTIMISYWEGACEVSGLRDKKEIKGRAYAELVGYDGGNEKPNLLSFLRSFF